MNLLACSVLPWTWSEPWFTLSAVVLGLAVGALICIKVFA